MKNKKVSVIITTRNEQKNIEKILKSIKKQTYKNIEIIIVDNNSNDKTKEIAKKYGKVFDRGPERSAQRNYGAEKSKGDYLLFLDADMELTQNVIKEVVINIKENIAMIIPEKSVGKSFWGKVKVLERNCYINDLDMELPRFYERKTFFKLKGFDEKITGQEIEDLYNHALKLGNVGRINEFIIHNELMNSLWLIINKKYYYCLTLDRYIKKSNNLAKRQFKFFRPAYLRNFKEFLKHPILTYGFLVMRTGESIAAIIGLYTGKIRKNDR